MATAGDTRTETRPPPSTPGTVAKAAHLSPKRTHFFITCSGSYMEYASLVSLSVISLHRFSLTLTLLVIRRVRSGGPRGQGRFPPTLHRCVTVHACRLRHLNRCTDPI